MKKRLLALALCLVMAISLLPITAAARGITYDDFEGIENGGIYCGDTYFRYIGPQEYTVKISVDTGSVSGSGGIKPINGEWKLKAGLGTIDLSLTVFDENHNEVAFPIFKNITINDDHTWSAWTSNGDGTHSRTCGNGCVESPQKDFCADNDRDCECDDCKASMHTWQFKAAGNTLTGKCGSCNKEVSVSLKADSVTLPDSPFNAQLAGWEAFKQAVPTAYYEKLVYQFNGPNGWTEVEPTAANAKAGEYQVGVRITGLWHTV